MDKFDIENENESFNELMDNMDKKEYKHVEIFCFMIRNLRCEIQSLDKFISWIIFHENFNLSEERKNMLLDLDKEK
jgi:hypothetical protein